MGCEKLAGNLEVSRPEACRPAPSPCPLPLAPSRLSSLGQPADGVLVQGSGAVSMPRHAPCRAPPYGRAEDTPVRCARTLVFGAR